MLLGTLDGRDSSDSALEIEVSGVDDILNDLGAGTLYVSIPETVGGSEWKLRRRVMPRKMYSRRNMKL